ncbi:MAG: response regulator [Planctomycetes bacterium]|nr:response regulator [Planctomycetota bacterium]
MLLIEDDDVDFIALHRLIDGRGFQVELQRARNASEALEVLRLQQEDGRDGRQVIVLDLNMPGAGGIEFLAQVRADSALSGLVVFAYTSSESPTDIQAAYAHHVAGYIVKGSADSATKLVDVLEAYITNVTLPLR